MSGPAGPNQKHDRDPMDSRVEDYYYRRPGAPDRPRPRFVGDTLPPPATGAAKRAVEVAAGVMADGCPGAGRCHGCMVWCDECGDVDDTCDDPACDRHRRA